MRCKDLSIYNMASTKILFLQQLLRVKLIFSINLLNKTLYIKLGFYDY